jgi:ankyrin repeat protein
LDILKNRRGAKAGGALVRRGHQQTHAPAESPSLNTELYRAVESGDLQNVEQLLAKGANVNTPGDLGFTPLHLAAMRVCIFLFRNVSDAF